MTCKLKTCLSISFDELAINSEDDERTSHKYLLEETIRALTLQANKLPNLERNIKLKELQMLKRAVKDLKILRVNSDYKNIEINSDKSKAALTSSEKIINDLNKYYS